MAVVPLDELQVAETAHDYLHSVLSRRGEIAPLHRPWITLAWAQASDGSIAQLSGEPAAISGAESLSITHMLRSRHSAILVGINTILSDNPRLTTRLVAGDSPRPIVLDSHLRCPPSARIFSESHRDGRPGPIVVTTESAMKKAPAAVAAISRAGGSVVPTLASPGGGVDLAAALNAVRRLGHDSVMVEGGGLVLRSFLTVSHIDTIALTIAPQSLDGYRPVPWNLVEGFCLRGMARRFRVGPDDLLVAMDPGVSR
ncbi:MAG: RibD family protein [Alkalispirochaeta sp.]